MAFGALDTATLVTTSAGLPIDIRASNATVTVDGTGTLAVQVDGDALTALQIIDNPVAVLGTTTYTEATTSGSIIGVVRNDTLAALADTDNEIAPLQVNASGALYIQEGAALTVAAHAVTNAGTFATQVDGDALTALQLIDNPVAVLGTATYAETTTSGMVAGAVRNDALAALAGTDNEIAPLQVDEDGGLWTHPAAGPAGGCKGFFSNDLDESEEEIAGAANTVYGIYAWNATAAPLWLQIFNIAAASVTVGTTAPTFNYIIPANADSDGAGVVIPIPVQGQAFATALTMAITTGVGTDNGAPGANDAGVYVLYQD